MIPLIFRLKYPKTMSGNISLKLLSLWVFLLLSSVSMLAQSKAELQRQRDALNDKIKFTQKLINEAKQDQEATYSQLRILQEQIRYRQQLQKSYENEIKKIDEDIAASESSIAALDTKIATMKREYGAMIYQAYKGQGSHDELMYIFASTDFNQAFKRFKIMQEYAEYRKRQANDIKEAQNDLRIRIAELAADREAKSLVIAEKQREASVLEKDKGEGEALLSTLKQEETKLRKQQEQQEAERQRINAAIRKIIEEELASDKKKNDGKFEISPEGKIVSQQFEQNKGSLPWPVLRGVITARFGKQAHETLPGIMVENNGVDIATEPGSKVLSVFGGTVSSVFSIPGAGQNIIVTHGTYKSVYTHLDNITVKKGDAVTAGETLGTVLGVAGKHICHLEIWKMTSTGGTPQNPELWITRR